ncbi:hypothetical protein EK599_13705 [Vibrio sp. T187]|uniref:hypothetical protein n=1 Tax=Vibrio TaxID=662 RepID=UPI0010C993B9|nr:MULTISPECIES: hypothetical protein [Vibrio]MBW3696749.1 hypothetical protein [Vibrio sp. T187]
MLEIINGIPEPFAFYPHCQYSLVEAIGKYKGYFKDIDRSYFNHTIEYQNNNNGVIKYSGVQLDVNLYRKFDGLTDFIENSDKGKIASEICYFYGIGIKCLEFRDFTSYKSYVEEQLSKGEPVLTESSLGYINTRRHYKKVFGRHFTIINGKSKEGYSCIEQSLKPKYVLSISDFKECFEYLLGQYGVVRIVYMEKNGLPAKFDIERVVNKLNRSLANLTTNSDHLGLRGLKCFVDQFENFYKDGNSVFIPGSWVFSHERIASINWLEKVKEDLFLGQRVNEIDEYIETLNILHNRWFQLDIRCEMSLALGTGRLNETINTLLKEIYDYEEKSTEKLQNIIERIG